MLGKALGYPPLYPDASDVDDGRVCVGDHVPVSLADAAAAQIASLTERLETARADARRLDWIAARRVVIMRARTWPEQWTVEIASGLILRADLREAIDRAIALAADRGWPEPDPIPDDAGERLDDPRVIHVDYRNWRGERSVRRIIPVGLCWDANRWHPEPQWLIEAWDLDRAAYRTFAWADTRPIPTPDDDEPPSDPAPATEPQS